MMRYILLFVFIHMASGICHSEIFSKHILSNEINEVYEYLDVDEIPKFNTDGINFTEYVSREFKWSEMFDGWKSISFFSFIITKEGVLEDIKLEIGMCPEIDREIIRVIKTSPQWRPGKKENKPVNVKLYFSFSCAF